MCSGTEFLETLDLTTSATLSTSTTFRYGQIRDEIVVVSNLVAVLLFTTRIAEDLMVNIISSNLKSRTRSQTRTRSQI